MTQTIAPPVEDLYPSRQEPQPRRIPRQDPVLYGGVEDGPLTALHLRHYENRGYLHLEGVFLEEELQAVLEELVDLRTAGGTDDQPWIITEPQDREIRSVFAPHTLTPALKSLCRHPKVVDIARQLLGGDVYIHQSRVNFKPGYVGKEFYWHSDFETWHVEDGMPRMRAVSCSISLTQNNAYNGPLLLIPGSHKEFVSCVGETPEDHYKDSLKKQEYGVPDRESLRQLADRHGIESAVGGVGSVTFFDCNILHGSASNISPWPRSNVFIVFNSVENTLVEPFGGLEPRPEFIANRTDQTPIGRT